MQRFGIIVSVHKKVQGPLNSLWMARGWLVDGSWTASATVALTAVINIFGSLERLVPAA